LGSLQDGELCELEPEKVRPMVARVRDPPKRQTERLQTT